MTAATRHCRGNSEAGHYTPVRIARRERGLHLSRRRVPSGSYRRAARASFGIDLGGSSTIDGNTPVIGGAKESVGVIDERSAGALGCKLVGRREMHEHRGDVPPGATRRPFPVVIRTTVDERSERGVLGSKCEENVVHGARLGDRRCPGRAGRASPRLGRLSRRGRPQWKISARP